MLAPVRWKERWELFRRWSHLQMGPLAGPEPVVVLDTAMFDKTVTALAVVECPHENFPFVSVNMLYEGALEPDRMVSTKMIRDNVAVTHISNKVQAKAVVDAIKAVFGDLR